ncbi:MAG: UDP-N-acetylmuramoyl-L-alanine--D-glutamate ligase [Alphaproteobacteria bacterium]|nr:UDP-N-acetylmuramoyl-L-alanine--D-glutamate ligase [Alphaproteobacteria bacterium]MCB9696934.1 UDP-N-acetylmuramoyl-L-alanine--D-glutamate ligase [Alphaproteobacteria bacterium]
MDLTGRRVLVVGLARSGRAAARLAHAAGARTVAVDLRTGLDPIDGVVLELGPHRPQRFEEADTIVVSPGIPLTQPDVAAAIAAGKDVTGEIGFAMRFLRQPVVGITGTNGKSTTTSFTGQLLEACGFRPFVGGNLGTPLCEAALRGKGEDVLVVELSSYQLELAGSLKPIAGVVLNLTPDHLGRHGTMEGYAAAKARLFAHMTPGDWAAIPAGDALIERAASAYGGDRLWLGGSPGTERDGRELRLTAPDGRVARLSLAGVTVPGAHNLDNAATAALLAWRAGADPARIEAAFASLRALPHRMQVVAEADGVLWVNDSKATNLDAALVGISGMERPCVVLLGGQGKPMADGTLGAVALAPHLGRHRAVLSFGEAGPRIADELTAAGVEVQRTSSLEEAVALARALARPGDAVLLSPMCASFDAFRDFEHRGEVFATLASAPARSP